MLNIVQANIEAMQEKYPNTITVMGGAYWASEDVHGDNPNFGDFVDKMLMMIRWAKFFKWHESIPQAMRTFCKLAMVDPMLVEAYIGMKFEEVVAHV